MRPKNCKLKPEVRWLLLGCNNTDKICKIECEYKKINIEKANCNNCKYYKIGCPDIGYVYDNGNYDCPAYHRKFWKFWVK